MAETTKRRPVEDQDENQKREVPGAEKQGGMKGEKKGEKSEKSRKGEKSGKKGRKGRDGRDEWDTDEE